jgi:hypothetical protein
MSVNSLPKVSERMPQVATTRCSVDIIAPNGTKVFFGAPGTGRQAQSSITWEGGLVSVETQKDFGQAVGGFVLTLDGLRDSQGRTWDQRIPMRSLVFITMERDGGPTVDPSDATVMIGFTEGHRRQESYSEAGPRRRVQIHGREVSSVLLDAILFYHPYLAANPNYGTVTITSQAWQKLPLALTTNPLLVSPGDPRGILQLILDTFLFVGGDPVFGTEASGVPLSETPIPQHPLITLDVPGLTLRDLLDPNYGAWNTFEPVMVAQAQFPTLAGSLWNYLHLFIDSHFQEFFTRTEGSQCRIHFRGKPFRHARITSGTRFKSAQEEPTLQTLRLAPEDILSEERERSSAHVYNFFSAEPRGMTDLHQTNFFRYNVFPQVITDHTHPSFVGRYGLRILIDRSPYLDALLPPAGPASAGGPQPLKPLPTGAASYADLANQIAAEQGLPPGLRPWFVANIHTESNFVPTAVSTAGAQGLGQLMPATQTLVGVTQPFDPVQSLTGSARYWQILRADPAIGDDPLLLVAAYNAGPGAIQTYKGIPPFPETQRHVRLVASRVPLYQGLAGTPSPATPVASPPMPRGDILASAQRWAAILAGWYDLGGELFGATLTVRGHPAWNVGHRLVSTDQQGEWEAYIEGVHHRYDMRTGQYLTTLRVTRGWYLSAASAQAIWHDGQTTATESMGGPPVLDPATGEPQGAGLGDVEVAFPDFPHVE